MNLPDRKRVQPEAIVEAAIATGSQSIAYTYTEPTIFFEYGLDVSKLAHDAGIKNVYVTNGFMTAEMIDLYHPWLDAANVDIKAFRDETFRKLMGGGWTCAGKLPPIESGRGLAGGHHADRPGRE